MTCYFAYYEGLFLVGKEADGLVRKGNGHCNNDHACIQTSLTFCVLGKAEKYAQHDTY